MQNSKGCDERAKIAFDRFIKFLRGQDKIVTAEDLIRDALFHYTYTHSPDGINTSKCILWRNAISDYDLPSDSIGLEFDAQLNIEIRLFSGTAGCFTYVLYHKKEERLDTYWSWIWDKKGK